MPDAEIVVAINGTNYAGWKAADVTCSMDALCGSFNVELSDKWSEQQIPREIRPGDSCQVFADGEPVITGYVDVVSPSIGPDEHKVVISGRDKTADMVDCSGEIESFEAYGITLGDLANELAGAFGIQVKTECDVGPAFYRVAVEPGETAFDCLDRYAKKRGVLCTTDGEGALVLSSRENFKDSGSAIVEGVNLESGSTTLDFRDRYSDYKTNGQMPSIFKGTRDPVHDQIGKAMDQNVRRYRPLFLSCEMNASCDDARIRSENECAYRAGKSLRVNITVAGWRHSGGELWRPRQLVAVTSDSLYLDGTPLVISTVRYAFSDSGGTVAELELTRPDAYLMQCSGQVEEDPVELFQRQ